MRGSVNTHTDNECICPAASVLNSVVFVGLGNEVTIGILVLFGSPTRNDPKFTTLPGTILSLILGST